MVNHLYRNPTPTHIWALIRKASPAQQAENVFLLGFNILATSNVISRQVALWDSAHSWWLCGTIPLGNQAVIPIVLIRANQSCPYPINAKCQARQCQASILELIGLTGPGTILPISRPHVSNITKYKHIRNDTYLWSIPHKLKKEWEAFSLHLCAVRWRTMPSWSQITEFDLQQWNIH